MQETYHGALRHLNLKVTPKRLANLDIMAEGVGDLQGTLDQQDMPSVTDSYPSWMRKTSCTLEYMLLDKNCAVLSMMFKKNSASLPSSFSAECSNQISICKDILPFTLKRKTRYTG